MNIEHRETVIKQTVSAIEALGRIETDLGAILQIASAFVDTCGENDWELVAVLKDVLNSLQTAEQGTRGILDGFRKIAGLMVASPIPVSVSVPRDENA